MFYLSASKPSSHQVRDREAWHAAVHGITRIRQDLAAKQQSHQAHKYNTLSIQVALMVKNLAVNAGDAGSIPGSGRSPGEGNGNPNKYSCLENPKDKGTWRAAVHRFAKSQTQLEQLTMHARNRQGIMSLIGGSRTANGGPVHLFLSPNCFPVLSSFHFLSCTLCF